MLERAETYLRTVSYRLREARRALPRRPPKRADLHEEPPYRDRRETARAQDQPTPRDPRRARARPDAARHGEGPEKLVRALPCGGAGRRRQPRRASSHDLGRLSVGR